MSFLQTRRHFLTDLAFAGAAGGLAGVGASGLIGASQSLAAVPPPETTSVRIPRFVGAPVTCLAPLYAAEEFLRAEGFTDLRYIDVPGSGYLEAVGRGTVDFAQDLSSARCAGSMPAIRRRCSPGCMSAASRASPMTVFAAFST
jgi:NitT/TauT family transport system substrate-binding protein